MQRKNKKENCKNMCSFCQERGYENCQNFYGCNCTNISDIDSILDKNKKETFNNLYYLSRVSDGAQILEFLLEFSLKYCSKSYKQQKAWSKQETLCEISNMGTNIPSQQKMWIWEM